jgi:hypothetical protein
VDKEVAPKIVMIDYEIIEDCESPDSWQDKVLQGLCSHTISLYEKNVRVHQRSLAICSPEPQLAVIFVVRGHSNEVFQPDFLLEVWKKFACIESAS